MTTRPIAPPAATADTTATTTKNTIVKTSTTASCCIVRATLLASLAEAKGYVASKHSILSSVRLTFNSGGPGGTTGTLGIRTTDGQRWYMDVLSPDSVDTALGTVTVICDAKKLHDIVKAMDDEYITLKGTLTKTVTNIPGSKVGPKVEHASLVQVERATGEYSVKGGDSTLFPNTPTPPSLWSAYDARALSLALSTAEPFVSKDYTRAHLNAALVEVTPDRVQAVATDGDRLAKIVRATDRGGMPPARFLVPLTAIGDVLDRCKALLPRKGATAVNAGIIIGLQGNTVFWKGEGARCYAVQHEVSAENFPPYNQVIPRTVDRSITLDRALLLAAAKRLLTVASKTAGCVFLLPASSAMPPHILLIDTDDGEGQTAKEKLPMQLAAFTGMPLAIGVNLKYLIEALDSYTSKTVYLGFNGNLDPIGVKSSATDEDIIVIMPMRL